MCGRYSVASPFDEVVTRFGVVVEPGFDFAPRYNLAPTQPAPVVVTRDQQRTLRWNRFGHPAILPLYASSGFPTTWWYDEKLAAKTGAPR